ncbi:hypothetical protein CA54_02430 [Symmachiella macrocystis]|uniref:Uncharacterized protein n=1 Tax=Symmachiella macrocystis TaxID=2527985 RepID=A0A5C6BJB8_9PLAN|nr:hypothetical protein [Symmachiella macrocystis]TWU11436.1 hypothetical protein CA54_02430 [Symmachiella macrocystis]
MRPPALFFAAVIALCFSPFTSVFPAKQTPNPPVTVGANVILEITGDVAKHYHRLQTRQSSTPSGIQISTSAQVVQKLKTGQYRLEHSLTINTKSDAPRMVTLTALVNADAIKHRIVPANTEIRASPSDPKPVKTRKQTTWSVVKLDDLKGVKIRGWKLDHKVGE